MDENGSSTVPKKRWKWGCIGTIVVLVAMSFPFYDAHWFLWGRVLLSTLPFREESDVDLEKVCVLSDKTYVVYPNEIHFYVLRIWPPVVQAWQPIPAYSPDGQYYVDVVEHYLGEEVVREELKLFEAGSNRLLGNYSYFRLEIFCWAKDSSGVYVQDYIPGAKFFLAEVIRTSASEEKKVLIPCRSSLEGVSLLPRLYWEIRCALPGSEHSPFAVWFPLVVMTAGFVAGVRLLLWLWRRWVRPWWYGE